MIEVCVIFHGHVQGVCFRATAQELASRMGLVGTVRNLPNGSVELIAQGDKPDLDIFIQKLKTGPGKISHIDLNYSEPSESFSHFTIIYR